MKKKKLAVSNWTITCWIRRFSIGSMASLLSRPVGECDSKIEMSPLTAKLKCPHGKGKNNNELERVAEVEINGVCRGR